MISPRLIFLSTCVVLMQIAYGQAQQSMVSPSAVGNLRLVTQTNGDGSSPRPAGSGEVRFISNGAVVGSGLVGPGGIVQAAELPAGTYSIVAVADDGFATLSTQIGSLADPTMIPAISLAPRINYRSVMTLIAANASAPSGLDAPLIEVPLSGAESNTINKGADGIASFQVVQKSPDNQVAYAVPGLSVYLLSDGEVKGFSKTSDTGVVEYSNLPAGRYALLVCGKSRLMVSAVTVTEVPEAIPMKGGVAFKTVSMTTISMVQGPAVPGAVTPPADTPAATNQLANAGQPGGPNPNPPGPNPPPPVGGGGGGFGGGAGGGVGGGGGGFGAGGLLGLAGLGAGIGALAVAADDNNNPRAVASPAR